MHMKRFNGKTHEGTQKFLRSLLAFFFATTILAACGGFPSPNQSGDIHKIKHVVVIMQENRSFDTYFGTYPGADGIPAGVCVQDPMNGGCVAPFHDPADLNYGGPHGMSNSIADIDSGRMDGFVGQA